jgi:hypothetical protein
MRDIFRKKVDSYSGLCNLDDTFAVSSKRLCMYFSIMLDLPTAWLPKNTIFILVLPVVVLIE